MDWQQEGDVMRAFGANGRVWEVHPYLNTMKELVMNGVMIRRDPSIAFLKGKACDIESALRKGESEREKTHQEALEELNLQPGDKVRVERKAEDRERGWLDCWPDGMDAAVGNVFSVEQVQGGYGVSIKLGVDSYCFPAHVLTLVERAQKSEPKKLGDVLGWDFEHPRLLKHELNYDIPDGYKATGEYRCPGLGELFLADNQVNEAKDPIGQPFAILRRKDEPAEAEAEAEAEGYWMVFCSERHIMNTFGREGTTAKNAEQIAKENPGKEVHVLETKQKVTATTTVESVPCVAKK